MGRMGSDWNVAMNIEDTVDGREETPPVPEAHPLEKRIGRLLGVVRLIEWSGSDVRLECPLCHGTKKKGHHAECLIAQAIAADAGPHEAVCPRCMQLTTPAVNGGHYCSFCQGAGMSDSIAGSIKVGWRMRDDRQHLVTDGESVLSKGRSWGGTRQTSSLPAR